jgi:hypothetical protein
MLMPEIYSRDFHPERLDCENNGGTADEGSPFSREDEENRSQ